MDVCGARTRLSRAVLLTISAGAMPYDPQLGPKIDTYLAGKGSPISGNGAIFFSSGVTYNVDPRLIVAIAGAESRFGTMWAACPQSGFNAWSWMYRRPCSDAPFTSFGNGIQTVTKYIRKSYLNKGYTSIADISTVYCTAGCNDWIPDVTTFYKQQAGDVTDLTFGSASILTITLLKDNPRIPENGRVTSNPNGISCGPVCSASFPGASIVRLTAHPIQFAVFGEWGGDCIPGSDPQTAIVTMDGDKACTAKFLFID